jgi:hypothetical protein
LVSIGEGLKQAVLIALGDKEMLRIMDAVMFKPHSVNDIIIETGIPHTTAYRKVKWLMDNNLIAVEKITITSDGKKSSSVRTTWKSFKVNYEHNQVIVEGEKNFNPVERTAVDFFSLDSP